MDKIKAWKMKIKIMNLMMKIWTLRVIKTFNLKAGRITATSSFETTQQRKRLEKVRRRKINFQV